MTNFETVKQNLEARGYAVRVFPTGEAAAGSSHFQCQMVLFRRPRRS